VKRVQLLPSNPRLLLTYLARIGALWDLLSDPRQNAGISRYFPFHIFAEQLGDLSRISATADPTQELLAISSVSFRLMGFSFILKAEFPTLTQYHHPQTILFQ
jgi:hypothetical protein